MPNYSHNHNSARRCEFCDGELSRILHTDAFGQMFLTCKKCGKPNIIGTEPRKSILVRTKKW
jgi:hypothetical protein